MGDRPPATSVERVVSLAWQTLRHGLHVLRVGRWLDRYFTCGRAEAEAKTTTAALAYFHLHQVGGYYFIFFIFFGGGWEGTCFACMRVCMYLCG